MKKVYYGIAWQGWGGYDFFCTEDKEEYYTWKRQWTESGVVIDHEYEIPESYKREIKMREAVINKMMTEVDRQLGLAKEPSVIGLLTEIRDELRSMRKIAEDKKQYETKTDKREIRYKGQFENTGVMERPETNEG